MSGFALPRGYTSIGIVNSFDELVSTPLQDGINALCWQRSLSGNFGEIVKRLGVSEGIATLDDARLEALALSAAGKAALEVLLQDMTLLRARGLAPVLECVERYARDEGFLPTDVYSFHTDSAPIATDTYLCTYFGPPSEGLRNDEAQRHVDIPATRAKLLRLFGGKDNEDFREFLSANCYDLHYAPMPHARPFSFGIGHLWRVAVDYPGSPVPPFIHRAPKTEPGQQRLLLIS